MDETTAAKTAFIDQTYVELNADLPHCDIYYTLDGTEPTLESSQYTAPITVRESCIIRAAAAREGELSPRISEIQLRRYAKESLRDSTKMAKEPMPGIRVNKYRGRWQTLDQMADRKPVASDECDNIGLNEQIRGRHTALAFEGLLRVPADGIYELFLESDDGSRLFVGDELIVDNDGLHGPVERSGHVGLRAGLHRLRVEWFNDGGGMELTVKWQGLGFEKQVLPSNVLFLP